ncbi:hypothetical protein BRAO285_1000083 [Bradyrhizobium sp. ORS 285]|nr:hypothetical protein BRAO285_1000083 [Bradyrhizobium sp. ORS 285]
MTIAKRPSSASGDALICAADLPDTASLTTATNWHDGQFTHVHHAEIARRATSTATRAVRNPGVRIL